MSRASVLPVALILRTIKKEVDGNLAAFKEVLECGDYRGFSKSSHLPRAGT